MNACCEYGARCYLFKGDWKNAKAFGQDEQDLQDENPRNLVFRIMSLSCFYPVNPVQVFDLSLRLGLRHDHQRWAQDALSEAVAFLQHSEYGVRFCRRVGRFDLADCLMPMRVEFFA